VFIIRLTWQAFYDILIKLGMAQSNKREEN